MTDSTRNEDRIISSLKCAVDKLIGGEKGPRMICIVTSSDELNSIRGSILAAFASTAVQIEIVKTSKMLRDLTIERMRLLEREGLCNTAFTEEAMISNEDFDRLSAAGLSGSEAGKRLREVMDELDHFAAPAEPLTKPKKKKSRMSRIEKAGLYGGKR